MLHLPPLIQDLALILGAAAVTTLVFKWLKQPVVLGYIIAGFIVGPNVKLFPTVIETESIRTWADIGVIFLLFSLGLEFSFKKLLKVGFVASTTAIIEVSFTMLLGYLLAQGLGWNTMDSIFLGGILAIASTTIIIRAFEELGVKTQKFTGVVMGVLIIEDLVAVVLMVLLSTLAIGREFAGLDMLSSVLKLLFFLVLWFVSGIFLLPSLLKKISKWLNEEILLVLSLALCFLMVFIANQVGFSSALGAFIMGSILAETRKSEKIESLIGPLKNLFGAIFFVSVGMLIQPEMLAEYAWPVLLGSLVLLLGKPFFVVIGTLLTGQPLKIAIQSGMSLSQIGEFSFIIASLGLSLQVTSEFLYPVAVAISVITTFTTPYMVRYSSLVYDGIEKALPNTWKQKLIQYSISAQEIKEISEWRKLLRSSLINIIVLSVIIISIILLGTQYLSPLFQGNDWGNLITAVITIMGISPFLWALAFRRTHKSTHANVWSQPSLRGPLIALLMVRIALAIFYLGFLLNQLFSPWFAAVGILISIIILIKFYWKIKLFYSRIETRFLDNLQTHENAQEERKLAPWDAHFATFELSPMSNYAGETLKESRLREDFGVNIASIQRGEKTIYVPGQEVRLFPHDMVSVIGTDEQLSALRVYLEPSHQIPSDPEEDKLILEHIQINENNLFAGKSIRQAKIRELTKGMVVGIEREGKRMLNPDSDTILQLNDVVWIVGDKKRIKVLLKK